MNSERNPAEPRTRSFNELTIEERTLVFSAEDRATWSDESLMAAIAAQDERAFSALYDRYADMVFSTSLRVLLDRQLAEDATQDIFVRLWQRPETYVPARGRFVSWIMSVTRNRSVDELRSRGRRSRRESAAIEGVEDPAANVVSSRYDDPAHAAQVQEEQVTVRAALEGLPVEQRRALELAYFGGLTQQEIAFALHEPLGTVKTRIRLGMQKLRSALESERRE
jgi:RNA polymerase sigma-70 factor, ECF subfamily